MLMFDVYQNVTVYTKHIIMGYYQSVLNIEYIPYPSIQRQINIVSCQVYILTKWIIVNGK